MCLFAGVIGVNRAPPLMLYPVLSGGPCLKKMSSTIRIATQGCTAIITNVLVCVQQLFLYQHCLQVFNKIKTFLFSVPGSFYFPFYLGVKRDIQFRF